MVWRWAKRFTPRRRRRFQRERPAVGWFRACPPPGSGCQQKAHPPIDHHIRVVFLDECQQGFALCPCPASLRATGKVWVSNPRLSDAWVVKRYLVIGIQRQRGGYIYPPLLVIQSLRYAGRDRAAVDDVAGVDGGTSLVNFIPLSLLPRQDVYTGRNRTTNQVAL